jgi:hypothetical protein
MFTVCFLARLTARADQSGRCSSRALAGVVTGWRMMAVPASSLGDRRPTHPNAGAGRFRPSSLGLTRNILRASVFHLTIPRSARRTVALGRAGATPFRPPVPVLHQRVSQALAHQSRQVDLSGHSALTASWRACFSCAPLRPWAAYSASDFNSAMPTAAHG